jgi:hypothetical protein
MMVPSPVSGPPDQIPQKTSRLAIVAANRKPFLCAADKILVMKNSNVIAQGY